MNTLETLAVVVAVLVLVKITVIIVAGVRTWIGIVGPLYKNKNRTIVTTIALIGIVVTGYYVFQSFSVVEVGAVVLFTAFLYWFSLLPYGSDLMEMAKKARFRDFWFPTLIWVAFAAWILYSVFWG